MKKLFCCILLLLLCVCSIFGCAEKIQEQGALETLKTEFTTEELLKDYDALWDILETDYLFLPELEQRGVDVDTIKEETRKQISERPMDVATFYVILEDMMRDLRGDDWLGIAHLGLLDFQTYEILHQVYSKEEVLGGWGNAVENLQTQKTYEKLSEELVASDKRYVRIEPIEGRYDASRKMVVFRAASFYVTFEEEDGEFIQNYINTLDGAPIEHIVFDITGNVGGFKNCWMDTITSPFGGNYEWEHWWYLQNTDLTKSYVSYFESWESKPISQMPKTHPIPEFVWQLGLTHFIHTTEEFCWEGTLSGNALTAKRWVLTDNYSYSAADSFAGFCKDTGWATLVGRRTRGDGCATSPLYVALPNTGILVCFSAILAENASGDLNTLYGTSPDFYSDVHEKPMDTLYRLIEE